MSLLMKALEKAAKDREGTDAAQPAGAADGLSLQPMSAPAVSPREPAPAQTATPQPARSSAAAGEPRQQQAATVINAGRRSGGGAAAFMRERPLAVFGLLAGIGAVGYGGYLYIQLTNPAFFARSPIRPPQSAQIAPPAPASATNPPATAAPPSAPLSSMALSEPEAAPAAAPNTTGAANTANASNAKASPAAAVAASAAAASRPTAAQGTAQTSTTAALPAAPLPLAPSTSAETPRESIRITSGSTTPVINPLLTEAYAALNAGNLDASQRLYNQMLRSDPGSIDALLGLAAISTQQGNSDEATRRYLRILEIEPRNAMAQAGLIGILGRADPQASETRVKQLLAREPSAAFLHFALGITYLDQKRWPDAQQAFFQAHQLQPDNPDYAFNLAVALEHIGQPKAALDYYRRAVQLAAGKGRANFSTVTAEGRIGKLEKVVK